MDIKTTLNCKGFTIFELMIVVTIAGIVGAFAVPQMSSFLSTTKLKNISSDLQLNMYLARSEAIKRGVSVFVTPNSGACSGSDWTDAIYVRVDDDNDGVCEASDSTLIKMTPAASNKISSLCENTCPSSFRFTKSGRLPTGTKSDILRFYVADDRKVQTRCVSLSLSGKPIIDVDNDNDYSNGCN